MFINDFITKRVVHLCMYSLLCLPVFSQEDKFYNQNKEIRKLLCIDDSTIQINRCNAKDFFSDPRIVSYLSVLTIDKGNGFAITMRQGAEKEEIVVAYSTNTKLNNENIPPAFLEWMTTFNSNSTFSSIAPSHKDQVEPLLGKTMWGQGSPFNWQCPTYHGAATVTGCVATAMAQVMKYHKFPDCGEGIIDYYTSTHSLHIVRDLSTYPFFWDKMRNEYGSKTPEEEGNAVASLMASCGASVFMDYTPEASGAYQHNLVRGYVRNFGYDEDCAYVEREYFTNVEWHSMLQEEISCGRPVNYGGASKADGGHSFVLDGFKYSDDQIPYYHINWGWNGSCDGYYLISDLRPLSNGVPSASQGFSSNQSMVIGVQPSNDYEDRKKIICASQLTLSSNNCRPGHTARIHALGVTNSSYKTFNGHLNVYITNATGDTLLIGKSDNFEIGFMERGIDMDFELSLPDSVKQGYYTILIASSEGSMLHSPSRLSLTVGNISDDEPESSETELSVSELEVLKAENPNLALIKAYELFNNSINDFSGFIYMAIEDMDGEIVAIVDSTIVNYVESFSTLSDPLRFNFDLCNLNLQLGDYRLRLYNKINNTYNSLLMWEQDGSNRILKPLSLIVTKTDKNITIDGLDFNADASGIIAPMLNNAINSNFYNLNGIVGNILGNHILIINQKKIIIK